MDRFVVKESSNNSCAKWPNSVKRFYSFYHAIKTKSDGECKRINDTTEKEMACREAALVCFKKHLETNELTIEYRHSSNWTQYTPINAEINKACENTEVFNEHLTRFGLKFERIRSTLGPNVYCKFKLSKLKD